MGNIEDLAVCSPGSESVSGRVSQDSVPSLRPPGLAWPQVCRIKSRLAQNKDGSPNYPNTFIAGNLSTSTGWY